MLDPTFERIGKTLRRGYDELLHEHLHERWIELITRLNSEENARRGDTHLDPFKAKPHQPRPGSRIIVVP